ncbi:MAG TPA: hypothetical protein VF943_02975 [Burkholderiales bacterium]
MNLPDASPFSIAALLLGLLGAVIFLSGLAALFRARLVGFTVRTLAGLLLLALGALAGTLALGIQGYRALTREDVAARIHVKPAGEQRFTATVRLRDQVRTFELLGDEIYVDARMLKWKPVANFIGLHTAYELDRVGGRYRDLVQERSAPRTIHALGGERPVDLFGLRRRYAFLEPLLDAEYGSGTFVPVTRAAELEVRVSTTGLLIRELQP